jgi:hypothetical protein
MGRPPRRAQDDLRHHQAPVTVALHQSPAHTDQPIADVLRKFVTDRSGGRIAVFQSSSAQAENPRVGRELQKELKEHLWAAGVVVLVYTSPEEDWSYCMWECGVATHPARPETKIVVLQCGPQPPSVYSDAVRVNALDPTSVLKFTNEFLTSPDFFPNRREAVAPGFSPNGDEVQQTGGQAAFLVKPLLTSEERSADRRQRVDLGLPRVEGFATDPLGCHRPVPGHLPPAPAGRRGRPVRHHIL